MLSLSGQRLILEEKDARKGYHWINETRMLPHHDYRVVKVGETLSVSHPEAIELCEWGLHAGASPWLAFKERYNSFSIYYLCEVLYWGQIDANDNKVAAEYRKCVKMIDGHAFVQEWAQKLHRNPNLEVCATYMGEWIENVSFMTSWADCRSLFNQLAYKALEAV